MFALVELSEYVMPFAAFNGATPVPQEDSGVASPCVYSGGLCRILPGRILTCGHT